MKILLIPIIITFIYTIIASLSDIKYNIIHNKLVFSLLILGFFINFIFTLYFNNLFFILSSIISTTITFIITYVLWKLGLWAGGDVKLITAISAIIPINFLFLNETFHPQQLIFIPFSLHLIINSLLISFPFILIYILIIKLKNIDKTNLLTKIKYELILFNIKQSINKFSTYLIDVNNLKEGMILDGYLFDEDTYNLINASLLLEDDSNLIIRKSSSGYKLKSNTCGGLTSEDILVLKLLYDNDLIDKKLFVKISIPFAPSICIAYIISLFYGNILFLFFN